jgi:hypothetical protein
MERYKFASFRWELANQAAHSFRRTAASRQTPSLSEFVVIVSRKMPSGNVTECYDRSECNAGAGIITAHDAGAIITNRVKAGDRLCANTENPADSVGRQPSNVPR